MHRHEFCSNCGERLKPQRTGRPAEYCDTTCRQEAHRKQNRHTNDPASTCELDVVLFDLTGNLRDEVRHLLNALENPHTPAEEPLASLMRIQQQAEKILPGMVGRARLRGVSWPRIGDVMSLHKDTVRRKYPDVDRILQRFARPRRPIPLPPSTADRCPGSGDDSDTSHAPKAHSQIADPAVTSQLAPVLSHLQRASKISLRVLGERTGLSAGHLARICSGERFPDWETTAAFARTCGADPAALRKVWEDADRHRTTKRCTTTSLDSALRYLHQRAGSPSIRSIVIASSNLLSEDEVTATLDGATVPDWEVIRRLVFVLDGEPSFFHPLWEEASTRRATQKPTPTRHSPRRPRSAGRLEELLTTFGNALATSPWQNPHLTNPLSDFLRQHPVPTPIPALTQWPIAPRI
ncbi:helix-turn-helix transcriptional regulator [Streptomyces sp. 769]|uniref:helix-turn-helix domain-containing protein n=1 Tax=Streptomyces sp. 769 TaxID=1262452 RepID=UPI000581CB68|nr:helix-turn-helix transcriptional regulator [Streptomyces sp. 769]AJC62097.1 hypothetical protein GZL_p00167 [Streptomyces sp. 769]